MPVEGQWSRVHTPLSRRDKVLLWTAAGLGAIAAATAALVLGPSGGDTAGNCLVVKVPSTMGGATLRQCGTAAHEFCRTQGRRDKVIAKACRAQGYAADLR